MHLEKEKKKEQVWTSPKSTVIRAVTSVGKRQMSTSCSQVVLDLHESFLA